MVHITIGFLHLPVVDHADALLGFCGFFEGGVEEDEVLVLGFGLREAMGATFTEPTVSNGELRLGEELTRVVGIDEGLEREASDLETIAFEVFHGLVEQHLVGLLGVLGDWVFVLLFPEAAGAKHGQAQDNTDDSCNLHINYLTRNSLQALTARASRADCCIFFTVAAGSSLKKMLDPDTTQSQPAWTASATFSGPSPPSISMAKFRPSCRRRSSNCRTFLSEFGRNAWAPKPGFTLMMST